MADDYVTKQYFDDTFRQALRETEARIIDTLTEKMRDMQAEILRGFEAHSTGMTIRMRKLEADQSNLDAATSGRLEVLERRLFEIEKRLGLAS